MSARHDLDTRATQNDEKCNKVLRPGIMMLAWDNA